MDFIDLIFRPRRFYEGISEVKFGDILMKIVRRGRSMKWTEVVLVLLILTVGSFILVPFLSSVYPLQSSFLKQGAIIVGCVGIIGLAVASLLWALGRRRTITGILLATLSTILIPAVLFGLSLVVLNQVGLSQSVWLGGMVVVAGVILFLHHLYGAFRGVGSLSVTGAMGAVVLVMGVPGLVLFLPLPTFEILNADTPLVQWFDRLVLMLWVGGIVWFFCGMGFFLTRKRGHLIRRMIGSAVGGCLIVPGVTFVCALAWMGAYQLVAPLPTPEARIEPAEVTDAERNRIDRITRLVDEFENGNFYDTEAESVVDPASGEHDRLVGQLEAILDEGPMGRPIDSYDPKENHLKTMNWISFGRYFKKLGLKRWKNGNQSDGIRILGLLSEWGRRIVGSRQVTLLDHLVGMAIKGFSYDGMKTILTEQGPTEVERRRMASILREQAVDFNPEDFFRLEYLYVYRLGPPLGDVVPESGWRRFLYNRMVGEHLFKQFANRFYGTLVELESWPEVRDHEFEQNLPYNGVQLIWFHPRQPVGYPMLRMYVSSSATQFKDSYKSIYGLINKQNCLLTHLAGRDSYPNKFTGTSMSTDCLNHWSDLDEPPASGTSNDRVD